MVYDLIKDLIVNYKVKMYTWWYFKYRVFTLHDTIQYYSFFLVFCRIYF